MELNNQNRYVSGDSLFRSEPIKEAADTAKQAPDLYADEGIESETSKASAESKEELILSEADITTFSNRPDLALELAVGRMDVFNYALAENDVSPIRGIQILNATGDTLENISLHIVSDLPFFREYEHTLPELPSGKPISIPNPRLSIDGPVLAGMTEMTNAAVTVELRRDGESLCGCRGQMKVLAYDQWQGSGYLNYLPAFVMPNHPVIPMLLHEASERLKRWGKPAAIDGYQSGNPNRVRDLAAAAFAAIQKKNITYSEPPAGMWAVGQRIRTPEVILDQHLGTCLDMTLLYASCLEAMGLHALLYLIEGHIFAGVWLAERSFEDVCMKDRGAVMMRMAQGSEEIALIECTAMCAGSKGSYEKAEYKPDSLADGSHPDSANLSEAVFACVIDVFSARRAGIRPIPSRSKGADRFTIDVPELSEQEISGAPTARTIVVPEAVSSAPRKVTNKRELWESKLLDLSTRNMLLNLPLNSSIEPIMSSHVDELEDALADGHEFRLQPIPDWIWNIGKVIEDKKGKEKTVPWLPEAIKEMGVFEMKNWPVLPDIDLNEKFRQEYRNHRMYTFSNETQLDRELTTIYRAARSSQQENGVSSLYLAIGLLRWFVETDSERPCYAPLILLPVEIVRKSANQGYALHAREDEPHFNSTLLEMLRQNYNLEIEGLEPLPGDEHGIDIKKTFAIVRSALFTVKNWDVVETCVLGNFSFAQFAMWNDIHTAGVMLENSDVVRSLIKGYMDWSMDEGAAQEEETDGEPLYLPISADSTQLKAIQLAAKGSTFVLHGPPGTGKSQTITGMIANLMAQGKTVLFVAEKMAALSVVQKRLSQLGIGEFCLELHSNKANKKQVLTQLNAALRAAPEAEHTEYALREAQVSSSRAMLDAYALHLHQKQACGYSLRELISLYETVRDEEQYIPFTREEVSLLTETDVQKHISLIEQLTATGEAVGGIAESPLKSVEVASYTAELRSQVKSVAERYQSALFEAEQKSARAAEILAMKAPTRRTELTGLDDLVNLYLDKMNADPLLLDLPSLDTSEAEGYWAEQEIWQQEEHALEQEWQTNFLTMDMADFLARHEAAGKKFFGKSQAMAAITAELQAYGRYMLTYEQIPARLHRIQEHQKRSYALKQSFAGLSGKTQAILKRLPTREAYGHALHAAQTICRDAAPFPGGLPAILDLAHNPENTQVFREFQTSLENLLESEGRFNELLVRQTDDEREDWFAGEQELCAYLIGHPASLKDWGLYNQIRQEGRSAGLAPVIRAYEGGMAAQSLIGSYRKGLYYALINAVISSDDTLSSFSGASFNQSIAQFKRLDEELLSQTRLEINRLLASRVPHAWDSPETGIELNLLRKAIGSNARAMSIRVLFERIPHVLQRLCPCMLMSPNSVAQYLPQNNDLFDVVIFDEASQLPTCKAVGALYRGRHAVIVGDPKQMPPTSFFAGSGPEVDDLALDDLDSILDDVLALGIPSQHLQWHYRSTHESLIAFSNHHFYENKMYTFPSANDRERHVTAVHVEGIYSKGINVKEAEAVVQEVLRRFHDPKLSQQSIGIVTFNVKQQTLIENLLNRRYMEDLQLDLWANSGEDPLFVKNLENVQGDERDVILFSIGYGPDEKGSVSNNFGPINKPGGGKRLNVAFSRARVTMTIFASLYSTDIRVTETSPDGLVAFHDFLKFAEGHDLQTEGNAHRQEQLKRAGILQNICKALDDQGLQYVTMVGHSDFHVDIAVIDPYIPDHYILGIMLDGEEYRRTKSTRDREVAQIGVLKHLGWAICRIWTMDWWDNRDREIKKLLTLLDDLGADSKLYADECAAEEAERQAAAQAREAEEERLKAELEAQAAEVAAEETEEETVEEAIAEPTGKTADETRDELAEETADEPSDESANKKNDFVETKTESGRTEVKTEDEAVPEKTEQTKSPVENRNSKTIEKPAAAASSASSAQIPLAENSSPDSQRESTVQTMTGYTEPTSYRTAEVSAVPMNAAEFSLTASKTAIVQVIEAITAVEAPIRKETLMRRVFSAFGTSKTSGTIEAFEKALKAANTRNSKVKGVIFCWNADQDPKTYSGIRVSNDRSAEDICPQEIANAICYVLRDNGSMERDDLLKETSRVLGYKRLGKNLEAALQAGLQYARTQKTVTVADGKFVLMSE